MFRTTKRTFQSTKRTFQTMKHTFHTMKYKIALREKKKTLGEKNKFPYVLVILSILKSQKTIRQIFVDEMGIYLTIVFLPFWMRRPLASLLIFWPCRL